MTLRTFAVHRWSAVLGAISASHSMTSYLPWLLLMMLHAGFAPGSLLYGRELPIAERVATSWGTHTLVDAGGAL